MRNVSDKSGKNIKTPF